VDVVGRNDCAVEVMGGSVYAVEVAGVVFGEVFGYVVVMAVMVVHEGFGYVVVMAVVRWWQDLVV
jgi:hypothetical protein